MRSKGSARVSVRHLERRNPAEPNPQQKDEQRLLRYRNSHHSAWIEPLRVGDAVLDGELHQRCSLGRRDAPKLEGARDATEPPVMVVERHRPGERRLPP